MITLCEDERKEGRKKKNDNKYKTEWMNDLGMNDSELALL